jgi:hypothetical protein
MGTKEKRKLRATENRDVLRVKQRAYDLKRKYNLTSEQAEALLSQQGNTCGLCGGPMLPRGSGKLGAVIDHDHTTGHVRSIVHSKCNCIIGFADDSIRLLKAAVAYLEAHAK